VSAIRLGLAQYRENVETAELLKEASERKLNAPNNTSKRPFLVVK
jgi:hypothetical protein